MKLIRKYRKEFKIPLRLHELGKTDRKMELLESSINFVAENIIQTMSIDKIWDKINLLANIFKESRIKLCLMVCNQLDNLYVTCKIIDWICQSEEFFKKQEIGDAYEFATLMITQQIVNLENNFYKLKQVYDPLAFPLAYEFLMRCFVEYDLCYHRGILELMRWVSLIRNFYPRDIIENTRNDRFIDDRVFISKKMNGDLKENYRRESLSIFDNFEEKVEVNQVSFDSCVTDSILFNKINFFVASTV